MADSKVASKEGRSEETAGFASGADDIGWALSKLSKASPPIDADAARDGAGRTAGGRGAGAVGIAVLEGGTPAVAAEGLGGGVALIGAARAAKVDAFTGTNSTPSARNFSKCWRVASSNWT